jgi:hypothetical protein
MRERVTTSCQQNQRHRLGSLPASVVISTLVLVAGFSSDLWATGLHSTDGALPILLDSVYRPPSSSPRGKIGTPLTAAAAAAAERLLCTSVKSTVCDRYMCGHLAYCRATRHVYIIACLSGAESVQFLYSSQARAALIGLRRTGSATSGMRCHQCQPKWPPQSSSGMSRDCSMFSRPLVTSAWTALWLSSQPAFQKEYGRRSNACPLLS